MHTVVQRLHNCADEGTQEEKGREGSTAKSCVSVLARQLPLQRWRSPTVVEEIEMAELCDCPESNPEHTMNPIPTERSSNLETAHLILALVLALGGACSGLMLPVPVAAWSCGDPCAALSCPAGSRCTFSTNCAPSCERE